MHYGTSYDPAGGSMLPYPQPFYQTPQYNYTFFQEQANSSNVGIKESVIQAATITRSPYPSNNVQLPGPPGPPPPSTSLYSTPEPTANYYQQPPSPPGIGFTYPTPPPVTQPGYPPPPGTVAGYPGYPPAQPSQPCFFPYPQQPTAKPFETIGWEPYPQGQMPSSYPNNPPYPTTMPYYGGEIEVTVKKGTSGLQAAAGPSMGPQVLSGSANVAPSTSYKDTTTTPSFDSIKAECVKAKRLWEDPDFPANNTSISMVRQPNRPVEWKRPPELCKNPKFIDDGMSRFDVVQGELGDCWVLAAVANLTLSDELINRVVPHDQTFDKTAGYCGAFRFGFWHYGEWREVVVDDRLPTFNGRLVYMHSASNNEFWSALLEKAYAKFVGCYDNLRGGSTSESMTDLTGGFCEAFELKEKTPKIFLQILQKAVERGSLMCCSINQRENMQTMAQLPTGLIMGHAYSVTDFKTIQVKMDKLALVRVRNPWGQAEWNGPWSDSSEQWQKIPEAERKKLGLVVASDGEFWMSFQDFVQNYELLEMCNLSLDVLETRAELERMSVNATKTSSKKQRKWETTIIHGEWRRFFNAGGCRNNVVTFATNPQYRIKLTEVDEQDPEKLCTVLIGLMQKDRRRQKTEAPSFLTVGFSIYQLKDVDCLRPLDQTFFERNVSKARSAFINLREVSGRFRLPPGNYAIIPSTFEPGIDGQFVLRIYSEKKCSADEIDEVTKLEVPAVVPNSTEPNKKVAAATLAPNEVEIRKKATDIFKTIAGDDGLVDSYEMQAAMSKRFADEFKFAGFNLETVRSMISLKDRDYAGTLTLYEFIDLYRDLVTWGKVFLTYDPKKTGRIEAARLRDALKNVGFGLSNKVFKALVVRYSDKNGKITFDDFVNCAIRLSSMLDKFKVSTPKGTQKASFSLDDFIMTTMYC